jgi:hypothetical protein
MTVFTLKQRVETAIEAIEASWDQDMARLNKKFALTAESRPVDNVCNQDFWLLDAVLARGDTVRQACSVLVPPLEEKIRQTNQKNAHDRVDLGILSFANMLQCMGLQPDPELVDAAGDWLIGIETNEPDPPWYQWRKGLAGLAFGQPRIYRPLTGYRIEDEIRFDPDADPAFNMQGWLAQFAAGVEAGVSYDDIGPLWLRFLDVYERLTEVESIHDTDIFWMARIARHTIGGAPLGTVADWMRRSIWEYIGIA